MKCKYVSLDFDFVCFFVGGPLLRKFCYILLFLFCNILVFLDVHNGIFKIEYLFCWCYVSLFTIHTLSSTSSPPPSPPFSYPPPSPTLPALEWRRAQTHYHHHHHPTFETFTHDVHPLLAAMLLNWLFCPRACGRQCSTYIIMINVTIVIIISINIIINILIIINNIVIILW